MLAILLMAALRCLSSLLVWCDSALLVINAPMGLLSRARSVHYFEQLSSNFNHAIVSSGRFIGSDSYKPQIAI